MKRVIAAAILVVLTMYSIMFVSTNPLQKEVLSIMRGEVEQSVTEGRSVDRYIWWNYIQERFQGGIVKSRARVTRLFVWHNFTDGYMWVNYTYEIHGNAKNNVIGSINIPSKWKIHRENGKWEIVDIEEGP